MPPPPATHDALHYARLRYFSRRLAAVTAGEEREYLAAEIAFERRTLRRLHSVGPRPGPHAPDRHQ